MYFHTQQIGWGVVLKNPLLSMYANFAEVFSSEHSKYIVAAIFNTGFVAVTLVALTVFYKKIGFAYWFMGIMLILVPLAALSSRASHLTRHMLSIFPIYILLARLSHNKYVDEALTWFLILLQGFLMVFWSTGFWFIG